MKWKNYVHLTWLERHWSHACGTTTLFFSEPWLSDGETGFGTSASIFSRLCCVSGAERTINKSARINLSTCLAGNSKGVATKLLVNRSLNKAWPLRIKWHWWLYIFAVLIWTVEHSVFANTCFARGFLWIKIVQFIKNNTRSMIYYPVPVHTP